MPLLSKTQVVLTLDETLRGGAWFSQSDPDSPRDSTLFDLCLPERTWTDMGSPQQISVTVEPGNTLSD
jgi:hypothetical protein